MNLSRYLPARVKCIVIFAVQFTQNSSVEFFYTNIGLSISFNLTEEELNITMLSELEAQILGYCHAVWAFFFARGLLPIVLIPALATLRVLWLN